MKENQQYIRKRRPINFTLDGIEYQILNSMPGTSRSLPSRSCKTNIIYAENDKIEEPIFSDGKNSNQNEDKKQPEPDDYYEEDSEEDPDPYGIGIGRQESNSSDSD